MKNRPKLRRIPWPMTMEPEAKYTSFAKGFWSRSLWERYKAGAYLLEVDESGNPHQAYKQ